MKFVTFLALITGWWCFWALVILMGGPPGMLEVLAFYVVVIALCIEFFRSNIKKKRRQR